MAIDIKTLEQRYLGSCRRLGIIPNNTILSGFFKAEVKKTRHENCNLELILDHLKDIDFWPLLEVLMDIDASEIEAVDVRNESSSVLNGEYALSLIRAVNHKLRVVDLRDISFGKDFLRDLSHRGLMCEVLYLRSSHFHKLSMTGKFTRIHTLNLDFSNMLTSFHEDCFSSMPNLMFLSMCETGVSNLWTTISALSKLPCLAELRFQKWLHSDDPEPCAMACSGKLSDSRSAASIEVGQITENSTSPADILRNLFSLGGVVINQELHSPIEESSDESEVEGSSHRQQYGFMDPSFDSSPQWCTSTNLNTEVNYRFFSQDAEGSADIVSSGGVPENASRYISYFASPICFERHYREYMIASLPNLSILDNLPIGKFERERAAVTYSKYFEFLPYGRKAKESVLDVLHKREIKASRTHFCNIKNKVSCPMGMSQHFYTRSLSAAKVASSPWPSMHPISFSNNISGHGNHTVRPRQFEYHPSDCGLMVVGTLDGEVFVINHETDRTVSYIPSFGAMSSVLGLCWLKKYSSMLIAGSDNGSLRLYNIQPMLTVTGMHRTTYDDFDQLTSVHVNSSDELFLASGYSRNVALYDIGSGRRLQVFTDMHQEHINVVKFANHSPFLFATSSFDRDIKLWDLRQKPIHPCYTSTSLKGNVMVCFSPDDHYLLASAVDNEVKQLLAVDGRVHMDLGIAPTGSPQNYTRSYYLNGRDYIISGSCDEHVVRICCAQTGRLLRDISLEGKGSGTSLYVQSLRGDPFRDFNMSILAADVRLGSKSEIVKVNMLTSKCYGRKSSSTENVLPSICMGG